MSNSWRDGGSSGGGGSSSGLPSAKGESIIDEHTAARTVSQDADAEGTASVRMTLTDGAANDISRATTQEEELQVTPVERASSASRRPTGILTSLLALGPSRDNRMLLKNISGGDGGSYDSVDVLSNTPLPSREEFNAPTQSSLTTIGARDFPGSISSDGGGSSPTSRVDADLEARTDFGT
jgi:hypothetical protein